MQFKDSKFSTPQRLTWTATAILVFLILWELAVRAFHIAPYILPTPTSIALKIVRSVGLLTSNAVTTFLEAFAGLALASIFGFASALVFKLYPRVDEAGQPLVAGFQSFPKEAIAPLLVVWFGFGLTSKLVVACSIAYFPVFVSTLKGLKAVPDEVIQTFRSLRATRREILVKARIPYSLPYFFAGIRVASTLSIIGAVIGEFVGSSAGLGHLILIANAQFSVDLVFGCLLVLGLMGVLLDTLIQLLERKFVPWHETVHIGFETVR